MTNVQSDLYLEFVPRSGLESASYWWSALRFMRAAERFSALQRLVDSMVGRANDNVPRLRVEKKPGATIDPKDFEYGLQDLFSVGEKREASFLGSEALHHLRSSLDHLVYHAAWSDSGEPGERTQFPICDTAKKWRNALKGDLAGLSPEHIAWIKDVQPLQGVAWTADLAALNNSDKHRLAVELTLTCRLHANTENMADDPDDPKYSLVNVDEVEIRCRLVYGEKLDDVSATFNPIFLGAAELINKFLSQQGISPLTVELPTGSPRT